MLVIIGVTIISVGTKSHNVLHSNDDCRVDEPECQKRVMKESPREPESRGLERANADIIKLTLSVTTCVGSVEFGTGSGPIPTMKMLNVDRTKEQKGGTFTTVHHES